MAISGLHHREDSGELTETPSSTNKRAMALVTTLFFMWGFLTVLNDILIPHLKAIFALSYAEVMLVQLSFFSAYFIFSLPSGILVERVGYKKTMVVGLCTMGLGGLLFLPAASIPSFPLFLTALIVLAAGMTALQVSANPYIAVLGPPRTASSRLNLAQAFNSLGTTIAPFLGSHLILTGAAEISSGRHSVPEATLHAYRLREAASVKLPYLGFAGILFVLALVIALSHLPDTKGFTEKRGAKDESGKRAIWRHRRLVLGALAIFLYVGAEVAIGSFLVSYLTQPYIGAMGVRIAADYVSFYWGGAMIGRFLGSALLQKVGTAKVLGIAGVLACLLVAASMMSSGPSAVWSILLVGLFNSVMFPSIFTMSIEGLGPLTGEGSGLLIAACVGGAVIPELQGVLADHIGIHHAFLLPWSCYLYIIYFAYFAFKHPAKTLEGIHQPS